MGSEMGSKRESRVRAAFSTLAAVVFLAAGQEWITWGVEQRRYWKLLPGVVLLGFSAFEAHQVWRRVDTVIGRL